MTTLLALYRRPEGGDEARETFLQRYEDEHLPLIRKVPGLLRLKVDRVTHAWRPEDDLFLVCRMVFADRAALDAALASDEMRAAGRNLREIAPGRSTQYVLERDEELSGMQPETREAPGGEVSFVPGAASGPAPGWGSSGTAAAERDAAAEEAAAQAAASGEAVEPADPAAEDRRP